MTNMLVEIFYSLIDLVGEQKAVDEVAELIKLV